VNGDLWAAALEAHQELVESGLRVSSRGQGFWDTGRSKVMIVCKYYKGDEPEKHVYNITAQQGGVKVDGPFIDSSDDYWNEMYDRDQIQRDAIVVQHTDGRYHYTIHKDSKEPGYGDGHGGGLFRFEVDHKTADNFLELGMKVEGNVLLSRNVWSQDRIPKKHWDKFPVNAKLMR